MTLASMTGFARIEGAAEGWTWAWEARSVNGRGLDVRVRLPNGFEALEPKVRSAAKAVLSRGNVQVSLQYARGEAGEALVVHEDIARNLLEALQPLVQDGLAQPARIDGLLGVRGVLDVPRMGADAEQMQAIADAMAHGIAPLFDALDAARRSEGAAIGAVLAAALDGIAALTAKARQCAAAQPEAILQRLKAQLADLREQPDMDPQRLAQEAALLALKADVREELDRLDAHIAAARTLLAAREPVGRKLEFLIQEFNREANTLCAKSSTLDLTELGLALKTGIDQMREQAANVE